MADPNLNPIRAIDLYSIVANTAVAVTPSDSTVVNFVGLYIGVLGDVAIKSPDNSTAVTFTAVPAGSILPIRCNRVMNTGTTATNIVGLLS